MKLQTMYLIELDDINLSSDDKENVFTSLELYKNYNKVDVDHLEYAKEYESKRVYKSIKKFFKILEDISKESGVPIDKIYIKV